MSQGEKTAEALCSSYVKGVEWVDNPDRTFRELKLYVVPLNTNDIRVVTIRGSLMTVAVFQDEIYTPAPKRPMR